MAPFVSSPADSASCIVQRLSDRANHSPTDAHSPQELKDRGGTIRQASQTPKTLRWKRIGMSASHSSPMTRPARSIQLLSLP
jgi:hypothetical protein